MDMIIILFFWNGFNEKSDDYDIISTKIVIQPYHAIVCNL